MKAYGRQTALSMGSGWAGAAQEEALGWVGGIKALLSSRVLERGWAVGFIHQSQARLAQGRQVKRVGVSVCVQECECV